MTNQQREMAIEFLQDPMLTTTQKTNLLEGVFHALPAGLVDEVVTSHQSGRINLAQALAKLGGGK